MNWWFMQRCNLIRQFKQVAGHNGHHVISCEWFLLTTLFLTFISTTFNRIAKHYLSIQNHDIGGSKNKGWYQCSQAISHTAIIDLVNDHGNWSLFAEIKTLTKLLAQRKIQGNASMTILDTTIMALEHHQHCQPWKHMRIHKQSVSTVTNNRKLYSIIVNFESAISKKLTFGRPLYNIWH